MDTEAQKTAISHEGRSHQYKNVEAIQFVHNSDKKDRLQRTKPHELMVDWTLQEDVTSGPFGGGIVILLIDPAHITGMFVFPSNASYIASSTRSDEWRREMS
ncbi:hypothetical protein WA026_001761 [Henosepilachna vigintioctopunctata]|uniref:Uncharacterized protein n=1 Tax=Henosepilachna vigintioctopunctata TaxID=420089 RepID=A0AAW1URX0_9CUCU